MDSAENKDTVKVLTRRLVIAQKLVTELVAIEVKAAEIRAELERVLAGAVGIGQLMTEARDAFNEAWRKRYRGGYQWTHTQDAPHLKKFIKAMGIAELKIRMARYLQSDDPFYVRARHGFNVFVATINQHVGAPDELNELELEPGGAPRGCLHHPPCVNDAAHTARYLSEMRRG